MQFSLSYYCPGDAFSFPIYKRHQIKIGLGLFICTSLVDVSGAADIHSTQIMLHAQGFTVLDPCHRQLAMFNLSVSPFLARISVWFDCRKSNGKGPDAWRAA